VSLHLNKIHLLEGFTHNLEKTLLNNELDAAIVAKPFIRSGVAALDLYKEDLVIITHKNHTFNKQKSIAPSLLNGQKVLLLDKDHCFRDHVLAVCLNCNLESGLKNHIL
jgi:LysR family transcriptional regulator, hydrogen peroxide-inducible genes activator